MKQPKQVIETTDMLVSIYVFGITVLLVTYMMINLIRGVASFIQVNLAAITSGEFFEITASQDLGETKILHAIAITLVLVKAYRILIEYTKSHHINIKLLVEICIISSFIEVIFNYAGHSMEINLLFGLFGVINLFIYVFWYDKMVKIGNQKISR
ncbi:hypothetical protein MK079_04185 [Candidatus Gracilibacteria bacterium]|nr:hypothetical protein [Candidatus Gracilibacteria bacterium]